jgi:hypothetical protein
LAVGLALGISGCFCSDSGLALLSDGFAAVDGSLGRSGSLWPVAPDGEVVAVDVPLPAGPPFCWLVPAGEVACLPASGLTGCPAAVPDLDCGSSLLLGEVAPPVPVAAWPAPVGPAPGCVVPVWVPGPVVPSDLFVGIVVP